MNPLLIIRCGSAPRSVVSAHGNFDDMIRQTLQLKSTDVLVKKIYKDEILPDPTSVCGAILTGSPAMVTELLPWILTAEQWVREAAHLQIPILGICFGHQLLCRAFGGKVIPHPKGIELGTKKIFQTPHAANDPLFTSIPSPFYGHELHFQTVFAPPDSAEILAYNNHDPHQSMRIAPSVWGVQFHPEFTDAIVKEYLQLDPSLFHKTSEEINLLMNQVVDHTYGVQLLKNFYTYCHTKSH